MLMERTDETEQFTVLQYRQLSRDIVIMQTYQITWNRTKSIHHTTAKWRPNATCILLITFIAQ